MRTLITLLIIMFVHAGYSQRRVVVQTYPDGSEKVVLYVKGKGKRAEKIKQEVYFKNGQLDFYGEFKNGVEHGEWIYYYEDGTVMAIEHYKKGREDGIWKEFHPDGQLFRETEWKDGIKIDVTEHR